MEQHIPDYPSSSLTELSDSSSISSMFVMFNVNNSRTCGKSGHYVFDCMNELLISCGNKVHWIVEKNVDVESE